MSNVLFYAIVEDLADIDIDGIDNQYVAETLEDIKEIRDGLLQEKYESWVRHVNYDWEKWAKDHPNLEPRNPKLEDFVPPVYKIVAITEVDI